MAWSNKQKQIAVRACKAAGMPDEHRLLLLRQFPNAMYDRDDEKVDNPTSTSKRLTNLDFEQYMQHVESWANGKLPGFSFGYWANKVADPYHRMRNKILLIAQQLELQGEFDDALKALQRWINKCVPGEHHGDLKRLNYKQLQTLLVQLLDYAKRHGVALD